MPAAVRRPDRSPPSVGAGEDDAGAGRRDLLVAQGVEDSGGGGDRVGVAGGVHHGSGGAVQGGLHGGGVAGVEVGQAQGGEAGRQRGGGGRKGLRGVGRQRQGVDVQAGGAPQVHGRRFQGGQDAAGWERAEIVDCGGVGDQGDAAAPGGAGVEVARVEDQVLDDTPVGGGVEQREVPFGGGGHAQALGGLAGGGGVQDGVGEMDQMPAQAVAQQRAQPVQGDMAVGVDGDTPYAGGRVGVLSDENGHAGKSVEDAGWRVCGSREDVDPHAVGGTGHRAPPETGCKNCWRCIGTGLLAARRERPGPAARCFVKARHG